MKKQFFKIIARINKAILPSYTKQRLDLSKATSFQKLVLGWRIYITKQALN